MAALEYYGLNDLPMLGTSYQDEALCKMERQLHPDEEDNDSPDELDDPPPRHRKDILFDAAGPYLLKRDSIGWYKARPIDVALVGAVLFLEAARHTHISVTNLYEIDRIIDFRRREAKMTLEDSEELREAALKKVPLVYHHLLDSWSKADKLPDYRPGVNHHIHLNEIPMPTPWGTLHSKRCPWKSWRSVVPIVKRT